MADAGGGRAFFGAPLRRLCDPARAGEAWLEPPRTLGDWLTYCMAVLAADLDTLKGFRLAFQDRGGDLHWFSGIESVAREPTQDGHGVEIRWRAVPTSWGCDFEAAAVILVDRQNVIVSRRAGGWGRYDAAQGRWVLTYTISATMWQNWNGDDGLRGRLLR